MDRNPRRLLDLVVPFRFLFPAEKDQLASELVCIEAPAKGKLFQAGDYSTEIYLLEEGQVELIYEQHSFVRPGNVVRAGHYFGERAALLSQGRTHGARAVTEVRCWVLGSERLLQLIHGNNVFAQAFGTILRDKHGVFLPLENFTAEVARSLAQGSFNLPQLIRLYRTLEPALHPGANEATALDLGALAYAVPRLPDNLTSTLSWYFTDDLPALYPSPSHLFPKVASAARRRDVWEMLPGKNMVLLRNGLSDILDFLTNLCLFSLEAQKIRHRLHDPMLVEQLLGQGDSEPLIPLERAFGKVEWDGLKSIWGNKLLQRLREVMVHHEDWSIQVERQLKNYNSRRSEKWANQISRAVKELSGVDPWDFPEDWEVHIVSSNTHSVTNCLSPWPRHLESEVMAWAASSGHPFLAENWENPRDKLYALLPDYIRAHPERVASAESERSWGILTLSDQSTTGIAVQLIDTEKLGHAGETRKFLVNIDYAFGEQAEEIIYNLITLFHKHIRSVNVLGKAGSLVGKRGDILVPTAFVLQSDDAFHPLPAPAPLEGLANRLKRSELHVGPLLTVGGTLLQNRPLLHFYRNIWKCIGLEMEGVYYARKVIDFIELGVLDPKVTQRYFYYVSDVPLHAGERLSAPLTATEGVPPLYAITREILGAILPGFID
jgi:hypothetical protein